MLSSTTLTMKDFKKAGVAIKVFGKSENRADSVEISNIIIQNSSPKAVEIGLDLQDIIIQDKKEVLAIHD